MRTNFSKKYDTATKLEYNVSETIDTIFSAVKDLCKITELA